MAPIHRLEREDANWGAANPLRTTLAITLVPTLLHPQHTGQSHPLPPWLLRNWIPMTPIPQREREDVNWGAATPLHTIIALTSAPLLLPSQRMEQSPPLPPTLTMDSRRIQSLKAEQDQACGRCWAGAFGSVGLPL
jgi:hypothetical protein